MAYFEITKEMLAKAATYMPLQTKVEIGKMIAAEAVKEIGKSEKGSQFTLPPIVGENYKTKAVLLLQMFVSFYFDEEFCKSKDDIYAKYDYFAGGNPINQLERYKSNAELRDKAFDILADYKELRKIVDIEIFNIRTEKNDFANRLSAAVDLQMTPENVEKLLAEVKNILPADEKAVSGNEA